MAEPPLHVAILDDDSSVRIALSRVLNAFGLVTDTFATGLELRAALETTQADCILLDLYMPGLDGLETMSYLQLNGVNAPVIIMTARDAPGLRERCLEAGARAYLRKPLEAAELLETIARCAVGKRS